jgi:hypothetical protein
MPDGAAQAACGEQHLISAGYRSAGSVDGRNKLQDVIANADPTRERTPMR